MKKKKKILINRGLCSPTMRKLCRLSTILFFFFFFLCYIFSAFLYIDKAVLVAGVICQSLKGDLPCHFQTIIDFGCHIFHYPDHSFCGVTMKYDMAWNKKPSSCSWILGDISFEPSTSSPIIKQQFWNQKLFFIVK